MELTFYFKLSFFMNRTISLGCSLDHIMLFSVVDSLTNRPSQGHTILIEELFCYAYEMTPNKSHMLPGMKYKISRLLNQTQTTDERRFLYL